MEGMTDEELNEAIAREVMGWAVGRGIPHEPPLPYYDADAGSVTERMQPYDWRPWSPATDIKDAFEVVEKVDQPAPLTRGRDGCWLVEFWPRDRTEGYGWGRSESLHRAICEAALKAVRSKA